MKYLIILFFVSMSSFAVEPIQLDETMLVDDSELSTITPSKNLSSVGLPVIYDSVTTSERYMYQQKIPTKKLRRPKK